MHSINKSRANGKCGVCGKKVINRLNLFYCSAHCENKAWEYFHPIITIEDCDGYEIIRRKTDEESLRDMGY